MNLISRYWKKERIQNNTTERRYLTVSRWLALSGIEFLLAHCIYRVEISKWWRLRYVNIQRQELGRIGWIGGTYGLYRPGKAFGHLRLQRCRQKGMLSALFIFLLHALSCSCQLDYAKCRFVFCWAWQTGIHALTKRVPMDRGEVFFSGLFPIGMWLITRVPAHTILFNNWEFVIQVTRALLLIRTWFSFCNYSTKRYYFHNTGDRQADGERIQTAHSQHNVQLLQRRAGQ